MTNHLLEQNLSSAPASPSASGNTQNRLTDRIAAILAPLGYEVVHLEIHTHRQKTLRLFIDHLQSGPSIGVEDCAKVSRALDEPLEQMPELESLFHSSPYVLEVSSPGVDRPLRKTKDFVRFAGREVRIHTFRPLTSEEIENTAHLDKNPKQKNFLGILRGWNEETQKVLLALSESGDSKKQGKAGKNKKNKNQINQTGSAIEITIPLSLISKANIEPSFDLESSPQTELEAEKE
jgi:ribosome maturation factor RimP